MPPTSCVTAAGAELRREPGGSRTRAPLAISVAYVPFSKVDGSVLGPWVLAQYIESWEGPMVSLVFSCIVRALMAMSKSRDGSGYHSLNLVITVMQG